MTRVLRWCHRLEDGLIVAVLFAMVALAVLQVLLRNLDGPSVPWVDPLLQNGVLWIALLGAMIATRHDTHIRIDLATRYLPAPWVRGLSLVSDLFTAGVCAGMAWFSVLFVRDEAEFPMMAFGNVPAWWFQLIIPVGFAVIALRYLSLLALNLAGRRPLPDEESPL